MLRRLGIGARIYSAFGLVILAAYLLPVFFIGQIKQFSRPASGPAGEISAPAAPSGARQADAIETALRQSKSIALGFGLSLTVLGLILAVLTVRSIRRPLDDLTEAALRLSRGDTASLVPGTDQTDEFVRLARVLEDLRTGMIDAEAARLRAVSDAAQHEAKAADQRAKEKAQESARLRRQTAMEDLTRDFNRSIAGALKAMASSAETLLSAAGAMMTVSTATSERATMVAGAAEQAAINVQTVAAAAEQLSASSNEIGRLVAASQDITRSAMSESRRAREIVDGLNSSSGRIGEIIDLINAIAAQTDLLALNATIEAARAGDAGKGFAVVAGEVKSLAAQSAQATGDIDNQVKSVQATAREAATILAGISDVIVRVNDSAGMVVDTIQQQLEASNEIARNVVQASTGTSEVTRNIIEVSQDAAETGRTADAVRRAAENVSVEASAIEREIQNFLRAIARAGERRNYERIPVEMSGRFEALGSDQPARIHDLSPGGASITLPEPPAGGVRFRISLPDGVAAHGRVVGTEGSATRLQFDLDPDLERDVLALLSRRTQ